MGKSLRFGLALLATVIVTGGGGSLGAGTKTGAGKLPGQADAGQPLGRGTVGQMFDGGMTFLKSST